MSNIYTKGANSKISFIVVLISVVLAFCVLIGTVSAWLTKEYNPHSEDNQIGEVKVELYQNGTKMDSLGTPYLVSAGSEIRTLNLTMRNNGTINCLVRATITIYYLDEHDNRCPLIVVSDTPTGANTCKLDTTSWVYDFAGNTAGAGGVAGGYMFYNAQLAPYSYKEIASGIPGDEISEVTVPANEKKIINSIRVSPELVDTAVYVSVSLEAIAYSGNIYKRMENGEVPTEDDGTKYTALPFGLKENLPSNWTAWA